VRGKDAAPFSVTSVTDNRSNAEIAFSVCVLKNRREGNFQGPLESIPRVTSSLHGTTLFQVDSDTFSPAPAAAGSPVCDNGVAHREDPDPAGVARYQL